MKTCVINVFEKPRFGDHLGPQHINDKQANIAVLGFSPNKRWGRMTIGTGKLLRSAGVAYRLRVTMKDKR